MIVIIDNYDSFTFNLYQSVAAFHDDVRVYRNDAITVDALNDLDVAGIVLSPGPGRPEHAGICVELIRNNKKSVPMLGVCLGLQAMMIAFGGQVCPAEEIVHGKHDVIFHHRKNIYTGLSLPFQAGRYHSLIADRKTLPSVLEVEAESKSGVIMGLRHRTLPYYGVQFHPESILTPEGDRLIQNFVQQCA
jgi:anthranilate synthase component 2